MPKQSWTILAAVRTVMSDRLTVWMFHHTTNTIKCYQASWKIALEKGIYHYLQPEAIAVLDN